MCHNSFLENEQIEKCIENGMPQKIVKTLKYTIRKRAATEQACDENSSNNETLTVNPQEPHLFISKCPFGHGKFTKPAAKFLFPLLMPQPPTPTTTSIINNDFDYSKNKTKDDSLLFERLPQISQLSTTLTARTADNNGNAITNLSDHFDDDNKKLLLATEKIAYYNDDILAKSTHISREFAYKMQQAIRRLQQSSKIYMLLTKTTQPAHLVAMGIVTFVLLSVWPELIDSNINSSSDQQSANRQQQATSTVPMSVKNNDMFALMAYLGSFAIHFGSQIWMTFVSGLSLYFSLPRHTFGQCQQILFPKYFAMNAALSITMLIIYVKFFINTWTLAKCVQFGALALTGCIELLVRLYLAPPLLRLMHEKYKIEGAIGSGKEIGSLMQGDLIKCPHYQRIHKTFRRLHMTVAMGNILTMAGSCLQLYNIAGQLQISIVH